MRLRLLFSLFLFSFAGKGLGKSITETVAPATVQCSSIACCFVPIGTPQYLPIARRRQQRKQRSHRPAYPTLIVRKRTFRKPPSHRSSSSLSSHHSEKSKHELEPTTVINLLEQEQQRFRKEQRITAGFGIILHTLGIACLILLLLYDVILANFPSHLYIR